jgi:hypothetical protein
MSCICFPFNEIRAEPTSAREFCVSAQHDVQNAVDEGPKWRAEKFGGVPPALGVDTLGVAKAFEAFDAVIGTDTAGTDAAERQVAVSRSVSAFIMMAFISESM